MGERTQRVDPAREQRRALGDVSVRPVRERTAEEDDALWTEAEEDEAWHRRGVLGVARLAVRRYDDALRASRERVQQLEAERDRAIEHIVITNTALYVNRREGNVTSAEVEEYEANQRRVARERFVSRESNDDA